MLKGKTVRKFDPEKVDLNFKRSPGNKRSGPEP